MRCIFATTVVIALTGGAWAQGPAPPPTPARQTEVEEGQRRLRVEMEATLAMIRARMWAQEALMIGQHLGSLDVAETCPEFAPDARRLPALRRTYRDLLDVATEFAPNAIPVAEDARIRWTTELRGRNRQRVCEQITAFVRANEADIARVREHAASDRRSIAEVER